MIFSNMNIPGASFIPGRLWESMPRALDLWDRAAMMHFRHHNWLPHEFWQQLRFFSDDTKGISIVSLVVLALAAWVCRTQGMNWKSFGARVLFTGFAIGISDLISYRIFKVSFGRLKPDVIAFDPNIIQPLSFPSSHAFNSFFICFFLYFLSSHASRKKWMPLHILGLGFATLVGLSRIYWLLHFPMDVVAGWVLGAFLGFFLAKVARKILKVPETTLP